MIIVIVVLAVLAVGVVAAVALQRVPVAGIEAPVSAQSFPGVPPGPLQPAQLSGLRFDQALRGYRMEQVDQVLDRLGRELQERDAEIARLRGEHVDGHL